MGLRALPTAAHRLLIVDDQELFRQGLCALLEPQPEIRIVAQAGSQAAAVAALSEHRPDIAVVEVARADKNDLPIVELLKHRAPALRIIALTADSSETCLRQALMMGVDGFLLKDTTLDELVTALHNVMEGRRYISPSVSGHLVDSWLNRDGSQRVRSPLAALTARERSILQLIAEGGSNRSAAERLNVSMKTVEKHRSNLMRKLGLRNAGELLMVAVETGLIEKPGRVVRLVPARA